MGHAGLDRFDDPPEDVLVFVVAGSPKSIARGRHGRLVARLAIAGELGQVAVHAAGSRPLAGQTLAFGLTDSPAGLAAWIAEKFRAWTDCGGDVESVLSLDRMLANISLYWFTGCIGASFHPYYARMHGPWPIPDGGPITPPTAYAAFPREIVRPPRSLAEKTYTDIRRWTEMKRGGHFAAMEQPEALAQDIQTFLRPLRAG